MTNTHTEKKSGKKPAKQTSKTPRKLSPKKSASLKVKKALPTTKTAGSKVDEKIQNMTLQCARAVIDKKALNTLILQVGAMNGFTEYFLISSGTNERQVQAMADEAVTVLKKAGLTPKVEGYEDGRWILVDAGFVLLHLFHEEIRKFYNLEELWLHAPRLAIPEEFYTSNSKLKA